MFIKSTELQTIAPANAIKPIMEVESEIIHLLSLLLSLKKKRAAVPGKRGSQWHVGHLFSISEELNGIILWAYPYTIVFGYQVAIGYDEEDGVSRPMEDQIQHVMFLKRALQTVFAMDLRMARGQAAPKPAGMRVKHVHTIHLCGEFITQCFSKPFALFGCATVLHKK